MAFILKEPGFQAVKKYLDNNNSIVNAVNLTESLVKLERYRKDAQEILLNIRNYDIVITSYSQEYIEVAIEITHPKNMFLSLGDRVCLATAIHHKSPVITADSNWKKLKLPIEVITIR